MPTPFLEKLNSKFYGVLSWDQLDQIWQTLETGEQAWFIYQVGDALPENPITGDALHQAIQALNQLLRQEHEHDYCGIVYADDLTNPTFIKVFDPNNLGSSCGCSGKKYTPRWVVSQIKPVKIEDDVPLPNNRKKWWKKLFG